MGQAETKPGDKSAADEQTRKDNSQESRRKHISNTIDVHYQQLKSLHEIRADHLNREHASEWDNQLEYSRKAEKIMRKKHVLEMKEHTKFLKSKETEIKKQYNATVGIQNRQYKALEKQMKDTLPKERQREVMRQVKDEQNRKVALLASQYERTMAETVQRLTVELDEAQLTQQEALRKQLQQEQDLLQQSQESKEAELLLQHEREKLSLDEKVGNSKGDLENQPLGMSTREYLEYCRKEKDELLQMMSRAATGAERINLERYLERVDKDISYVKNEIAKESKEFDDAIKAGYVTVNVVNALMLGMAGVGKTSFKHILLGLQPPDIRSSTPLADAPILIHVQDVSGVKVQTGESGWKPVEGNDLQKIVTDTISTIVSNLKDVPESKKRELQEQVASIATVRGTQTSARVNTTGQSTSTTSSSHIPRQSAPSSEQATHGFQGVIGNFMGVMVSMVADKLEEIQISGCDPREVLGSNWIYFTDSGGQPHFHNLIPHFVQGISAALFVHRLSERLDAHPLVEYYEEGRPISAPHRSPLTAEDTLKCLVRSMQTRTVDGEKPNLVFLGTFLDKILESSETLEEKNEKLLKLLSSEFRDQLVFYNEAKNQLIFAVDAKHPGALEDQVAKLIRAVVEGSPSREIKVPIWWYVLEIVLEKFTHLHGQKVLSKKECLEAAYQLNFLEQALTAALKFFHKQNIFHYFPEVLPEVVFCSPQVLLDKLTELVKDAYIMREAVSNPTIAPSQAPATTVGKRRHVRDNGVVTLEYLEQFPQHYVDSLFTPPDLLKIFMRLLILTPFSTTLHGQVDFSSRMARYYMPSLLDMLPSAELEKQRIFSAAAAPMLIRFPNGWPRSGVFCCLQVDLIQNRMWELVHKDGKPKLIAQNCVMLSPPKSACVVTLIDSFSYLEVHINADPSVCRRVCPLVRDCILHGIDASCRALRYASDLPDLAFFCPLDNSPSTDLSSDRDAVDRGIPQRHSALVLKEDNYLQCTIDHDKYSQLEAKHLIWLQGIPTAEGKCNVVDVNMHLHHVKNAVLDAAYLWREIGQALYIRDGTLRSIRGEDNHCLNEMLTKWMHSGKATIEQLLEALQDPSVKRGDIVAEIRAFEGDKRSKVGLSPK